MMAAQAMTDHRKAVVPLDAKVAFLRQPGSYPDRTESVQAIETHMSWVFLTDSFAYKLKKPVRHEFLDFGTLEKRRHFCEEEVRLNQDLAGGVYIGAVPLVSTPGETLSLGGSGTVIDWLVKSRRLPAENTLDRAITTGRLTERDVREVAALLASFYSRCPPDEITPREYKERFRADLAAIRRELGRPEYRLPETLVVETTKKLQGLFEEIEPVLDERVKAGKIIEGHGDLRPEHVYLIQPPAIVDRLEFNRDFRALDPVEELSYLAMECDLLGENWVGELVLAVYAKIAGDETPASLISFHKAFRACLRAKIAAWHIDEPREAGPSAWIERARRYLSLAERYLAS